MKVLFAVNDENISASIVKRYQKEYKEIISYKSVYYFNAILKELQRNKSYDRVVISEDLEEFTSSSFEQKDKFIFDKLDNISDEAVNDEGIDIPVILICSDRRNKAEDILVKLFGIGIYNAIIGDDRSIDEVCRLINKPRSKKEAKIYYQIDSEKVNYQKGKEDDVKEEEIQNILLHFKRLGKDEDKYVESFERIASQYNDEQLRVIIAVLPTAVKTVLRERSDEYQRIIHFEEPYEKRRINQNLYKSKKENKGNTGRLLGDETKEKMLRPVVVPTTLEKSIYKEVNPKKKINIDMDEIEEDQITQSQLEESEAKPKRRGRPRKKPIEEEPIKETQVPKRRGRPKKAIQLETLEEDEDDDILPGLSNSKSEEYDDDNILPGFDDEEEILHKTEKRSNNDVLPGFDDDYEKPTFDEDNDDDNMLTKFYKDENSEEDADTSEVLNPLKNTSYDEEDRENDSSDEYEYDNNTSNVNLYNEEDDEETDDTEYNQSYDNYSAGNQNNSMEKYNNVFDEEFDSLLIGDKKIATFVGTSKNGTSFIVNNVAQILSEMGINTAILDTTKNRNSYYIYTNDDEDLRKAAINSIESLINDEPQGLMVNENLSVYTSLPSQYDQIKNSYPILENLIRKHSIVLIDCDFDTPVEYFDKSQEIYLVQSMDVLTIQPLTEFLRELKDQDILEESKIRIILNKILRIKGVNGKNIIGGMSKYNNPEMSLMKDLFNVDIVKVAATLPFDEDVYTIYLESLIECEIKANKYPKEFRQRLVDLAGVIYPLLPSGQNNKKNKKDLNRNKYSNSFTSNMNDTLDNMRKRY